MSGEGPCAAPLWHGGPPLRGDRLLPGTVTGRTRSGGLDAWVYVTPTRSLAVAYAATCAGWLYEVEPVGEVEQDPGSMLAGGQSLRCREARVVRRYKPSRQDVARVLAVIGPLVGAIPKDRPGLPGGAA